MADQVNVQHIIIEHSPDDPEAFVCRSADLQISSESRDIESAINFVKGASLCALGELWKKVPDDVHIKFEINYRAVEMTEADREKPHCDYRMGDIPGVIACKRIPVFTCGCPRCDSERADGKFRSCAEHRGEVSVRHTHIYPRYGAVWYGMR